LDNSEKKTRVGIITFHRAINYGALLQTYALQTSVEKLGCECEVIDYHNERIERQYKKFTLMNAKGVKDVAKIFLYATTQNRKYDKFRSFASRYLHLSPVCRNYDELIRISSRYDILISGSDQVWNYRLSDYDKAYFLKFEKNNKKKNAYAASFGISEIPEEKIEDYRKLLKDYNQITVREKRGAELIKNLTGRDVGVALDPTLLLRKEEWDRIAEEKQKKSDYILIYSFGLTKTMNSFVDMLSKRTGCRVIFFPVTYSIRDRIKARYVKNASPEDYLGFFKNARYVVTNSFHGTVFSITYNKPFFLERHSEHQHNNNSRFDNLLDLLELHDREIIKGENHNIDKPIDYLRVNSILEQERMKSMAYLERLFSVSE